MKRPGLTLLVLAALALGYLATAHVLRSRLPSDAPDPAAKLDWLAREFSLTPAQVAAISRLQTDYAPICAGHCAAIASAQDLLAAAANDTERAAARATLARLEKICADATRTHLHAVAACMPPHQAARFLALMEPRVAHASGRTGAPALDGQP